MARLPRLTVPGYPHHIIQRGNNRQPIFAANADYETLLVDARGARAQVGVAIHAYVLMSNHFHLLATPETAAGDSADDAGGRAALCPLLQPAAGAHRHACGRADTGRP